MSGEPISVVRDNELDFIAFLRVLWEFKFLIVFVAAVSTVTAVVLALNATEIYRAEAVVAEVQEDRMSRAASLATQLGGLATLAGVDLGIGGADREAQAVLQSRYLVERFIERNGLMSELLPGAEVPPTLWMAVRQFRETVLNIREDALGGVITVSMSWTDPVTAADWANGFVALANELIRARALADASRNIDFLNKQIENTNVVEVQRVLYNLIENETKTLMLANVRGEYAFRIIDPAVPPELRSSPRRTLMVLVGGFVGLFLGVFLAFSYNLFRRIRAGN